MAYPYSYSPRTGTYSRRRKKRRSTGALGSLGGFGQASSMKATLGSVKGVLITGAIAAGGAVITDKVYDKIGSALNLDGWKMHVAKMATGIALGILLAKLTKKPKLAAAFAIGPVVVGAMRLFGDIMGNTAGLGLVAYNPVNAYESMYAPLYGNQSMAGMTTYNPVEGPARSFVPPPPISAAAVGASVV